MSLSMTMSKIIVIRPSTIKVLDRCSAVAWSPSSSVFSGVISSSVMISRLSRSGYVTFLPPAHFKQSFHEFCYWRLCGVWYEPLVGMCCCVYEYIDYFGDIFVLWTRGDRFWIGVQQLALCGCWSYTLVCLPILAVLIVSEMCQFGQLT